jgi:hypothetical protein
MKVFLVVELVYFFHRANRHTSYICKHVDSTKFANNDSRMSVEKNCVCVCVGWGWEGLPSSYVLDLYW